MTPGFETDGGHETLEAAEEQLNALLTLLQSADTLFTSFAEQVTALVHDQEQLVQVVRDHNDELDHGLTATVTDAFSLAHDGASILNSFSGSADQANSMLDHLQSLTHDIHETEVGIIREDVANFSRLQTETQQVIESFDGTWQGGKDALAERQHEVASLAAVFLSALNDLRQKLDSFRTVETQIVDLTDNLSSRISPVFQSDLESLGNALQGLMESLSTTTDNFASGTQTIFAHVQSAGQILQDELNTVVQSIDQASAQYTVGDPVVLHSEALHELQELSKTIQIEVGDHDTEAHAAGELSLQMLHFEQDAHWLQNAIEHMHGLLKKLDGDKAAKEHAAAEQAAQDGLDHHALVADDQLHAHDDHLDHFHP